MKCRMNILFKTKISSNVKDTQDYTEIPEMLTDEMKIAVLIF